MDVRKHRVQERIRQQVLQKKEREKRRRELIKKWDKVASPIILGLGILLLIIVFMDTVITPNVYRGVVEEYVREYTTDGTVGHIGDGVSFDVIYVNGYRIEVNGSVDQGDSVCLVVSPVLDKPKLYENITKALVFEVWNYKMFLRFILVTVAFSVLSFFTPRLAAPFDHLKTIFQWIFVLFLGVFVLFLFHY